MLPAGLFKDWGIKWDPSNWNSKHSRIGDLDN